MADDDDIGPPPGWLRREEQRRASMSGTDIFVEMVSTRPLTTLLIGLTCIGCLVACFLVGGCTTTRTVVVIPLVEMTVIKDSCASRPAPSDCA